MEQAFASMFRSGGELGGALEPRLCSAGAFDLGVQEACLWRELIDRLMARGESLGEAIGMADDMMHARKLRMQEGRPPSEPPPPPVREGDEEPLG